MKVTLHRIIWKHHGNGNWVPELFKIDVEKTLEKDGHYYTFPAAMDRDVQRYFFLNPGERYVKASLLLDSYPAMEDIELTFKNALFHQDCAVKKLSKQMNEETKKGMQLAALRDLEVD